MLDDVEVGVLVFLYLGMDDMIIDIDVMLNWGDMLLIYGNVNDLVVIYVLDNGFISYEVVENGIEWIVDLIKVIVVD